MMLVFSRKQGEVVIIGENIRLTVVAVRGNQVRLGVTAPPDVPIQREELLLKARDFGAASVRPAASEEGP